MSERIHPLGDRVVIRQLEAEAISEGGIVIAGDAAIKPHEGIVLDVGPTCANVTEGDKVLFGEYVGQEVEVNGEKLRILSEDEIIAILV